MELTGARDAEGRLLSLWGYLQVILTRNHNHTQGYQTVEDEHPGGNMLQCLPVQQAILVANSCLPSIADTEQWA